MSDQEDSAPAEDVKPVVSFDALDSHLMRRTKFFENEALMLAVTLRDALSEAARLRQTPAPKRRP